MYTRFYGFCGNYNSFITYNKHFWIMFECNIKSYVDQGGYNPPNLT